MPATKYLARGTWDSTDVAFITVYRQSYWIISVSNSVLFPFQALARKIGTAGNRTSASGTYTNDVCKQCDMWRIHVRFDIGVWTHIYIYIYIVHRWLALRKRQASEHESTARKAATNSPPRVTQQFTEWKITCRLQYTIDPLLICKMRVWFSDSW